MSSRLRSRIPLRSIVAHGGSMPGLPRRGRLSAAASGPAASEQVGDRAVAEPCLFDRPRIGAFVCVVAGVERPRARSLDRPRDRRALERRRHARARGTGGRTRGHVVVGHRSRRRRGTRSGCAYRLRPTSPVRLVDGDDERVLAGCRRGHVAGDERLERARRPSARRPSGCPGRPRARPRGRPPRGPAAPRASSSRIPAGRPTSGGAMPARSSRTILLRSVSTNPRFARNAMAVRRAPRTARSGTRSCRPSRATSLSGRVQRASRCPAPRASGSTQIPSQYRSKSAWHPDPARRRRADGRRPSTRPRNRAPWPG